MRTKWFGSGSRGLFSSVLSLSHLQATHVLLEEELCGGAILKEGLTDEQKHEFLELCKMDVCFGAEGCGSGRHSSNEKPRQYIAGTL